MALLCRVMESTAEKPIEGKTEMHVWQQLPASLSGDSHCVGPLRAWGQHVKQRKQQVQGVRKQKLAW